MATCSKCGAALTELRKKDGSLKGYECPDCEEFFKSEEIALRQAPMAGPQGGPDELPFPIAYPLAYARDDSVPAPQRVDNVIFTAYQAMRTTALLLLADYLESADASQAASAAIRGLRMPHWSEWTRLCDKLALLAIGKDAQVPAPTMRLKMLAQRWLEVSGRAPAPWAAQMIVGLPGLESPTARSLNDAIWKARNLRAHRSGTAGADNQEDINRLRQLLPVAEGLATHLFPPGELTLYRRVQGQPVPSVIRLHGAHHNEVPPRFEIEGAAESLRDALETSDVIAAINGGAITLHPLFVAADVETARHASGSGGFLEPLSLIDGANERRVVLLGVRGSEEHGPLAQTLLEALKRKQVDFGLDRQGTTRWMLLDWASASASNTVQSLTGRKYFPSCYLTRSGVDEIIDQALKLEGRALLVLGNAGSGKSSLLARTVEHLIGPIERTASDAANAAVTQHGGGDVVLYLSGRGDFSGDIGLRARALLCEAVCRKAGIKPGAFNDLNDFAAHLSATAKQDTDADRRVILVLDALNEADRFTDLLKALDAFLPTLKQYPWFRVIVSMRLGAYQSLQRRQTDLGLHGQGVFDNEGVFMTFFDEQQKKAVPYLELRPFRVDDEGPRAYNLRQQALPSRSASVSWDNLSPEIRQLLLAPLYLHVFHDTFKGAGEDIGNLNEDALLDAYLEALEKDLPFVREKLQRIGRVMFETRSPEISSGETDAWVAEWRRSAGAAALIAKLDPVEELVASSLLMRVVVDASEGKAGGLQFSHQRLCERVLCRELRRQIGERELPTGEELRVWVEYADADEATGRSAFAELQGALNAVGRLCSRHQMPEPLVRLLGLSSETAREVLINALSAEAIGKENRAVLMALRTHAITPALASNFEIVVDVAHNRLAFGGARLSALYLYEALLTLERTHSSTRERLGLLLSLTSGDASVLGRSARARACLKESVELFRDDPGNPVASRNLSFALTSLANFELNEGNFGEARHAFDEALRLCREALVENPGAVEAMSVVCAVDGLRQLETEEGNPEVAIKLLAESREMRRRAGYLLEQQPAAKRDLLADLMLELSPDLERSEIAGDPAITGNELAKRRE